MCHPLLSLLVFACIAVPALAQNAREKKVRDDKVKIEGEGFWIYNDLPKAFAEAKEKNKPLVVVLRCIPCEECVKLDDELVDKNPTLRPLLDDFVRVRVVSTNGLDLSLFQFDTDQSFAVFFLNADGAIYGRYGTRSHRTNWVGDVSIDGLAKALAGALELHKDYPKNKAVLAAKRGPAPTFPVPEKFPALGKYGPKLATEGNIVQSCIHCHQIGDAAKTYHRQRQEPMPESVLFPYPHPKVLGVTFKPKFAATVDAVIWKTPAAKTLMPSDEIRMLAGQPILSVADVQWVLHQTNPAGAELPAEVIRAGKPVSVVLQLPAGWKSRDDISWRSSSWGLRRMATGGMLLETPEEKKDTMALRAKHVGQYGPHAAAKNAGFLAGDVIVSFDGKTDLIRETDLFAYALRKTKPGDKVAVEIERNGKRMTMSLPMQE